MKTQHLLPLFLLLITIACNNNTPQPGTTTAATGNPRYASLIPLPEAQQDIRNFISLSNRYLDSVPIRAYTLHSLDMLLAMGLPAADTARCKFSEARVYLAYGADSFKLFMVPVLADGGSGKDIMLDSAGNPLLKYQVKDAGTQYVLDLNAPCPRTCDTTSSLYQ